ncbi:MAG: GNAT family N-acetyltransferase [Cyanobacteria bacterium P01_E01_bin.35]
MADNIQSNVLQIDIDNFIMRSLKNSDLDDLAEIWADPEVTRFLPSRGLPISRENTKKSLQSFIEHWQQREYGIWAIIDNSSLRMIGYCGLRYLDELDEVEILYGLAKTYWGREITTKAAEAAINYGFKVVELERVIAMVLPDNIASIKVIENAGLQYEKQIHLFGLDVLYYSRNN